MSLNAKEVRRKHHGLGLSKIEKVAIPVVILLAIWVVYSVMQPVSPGQQTVTSTSSPAIPGDPTLQICITGAVAEHIHPHLQIVVNGQPIVIPANIGISDSCTRPIHTHDASGTIHVESPVSYPFTLHDFFLVWGQPFDSAQILRNHVDSTHTLRMTVNSIPNTQYENYVLQDGDQIVIIYGPAT